jgi:hypothetical protein
MTHMIRSLLAMLFVLVASTLACGQCFAPLSDPLSTNRNDWNDLVNFVPSTQSQGVVRILTIAGGTGDKINLDFYSVTFRRHPTKSLSTVFRDIRRRFLLFAHSKDSETYFEPYQTAAGLNDPLRIRNMNLWNSDNPKDAVMSFTLASFSPGVIAMRSGLLFGMEQGDVVVTCAGPTQFIFSTAYTVGHTDHPVSGNRLFGIKDNSNGTWTFYSKGADRETKYLLNNALKRGAKSPEIEGSLFNPNEDAVFQAGHKFWLEFFPSVMDYVQSDGMSIELNSFVKNSRRYPYPP